MVLAHSRIVFRINTKQRRCRLPGSPPEDTEEHLFVVKKFIRNRNSFIYGDFMVTSSVTFFLRIYVFFELLKGPQVIETRAFPRIGYVLITAKTQVIICFVQYLNFD